MARWWISRTRRERARSTVLGGAHVMRLPMTFVMVVARLTRSRKILYTVSVFSLTTACWGEQPAEAQDRRVAARHLDHRLGVALGRLSPQLGRGRNLACL